MPKRNDYPTVTEVEFTLDEVVKALAWIYNLDEEAYAWGWLEMPADAPLPTDGRFKVIAMQRKDK